MKITIVGGGNIGIQFAVHCASKGHNVKIYTSKYSQLSDVLRIVDENNNEILRSEDIKTSFDAEYCFSDVELIFVTLPAFCMDEIALKLLPYASRNLKICVVPGTGGAELAFNALINEGVTVFGLQRVPSMARLIDSGKTVKAVGYRNALYVASIPNARKNECAEIIESIFDINCNTLPNYLNITLTPSNSILHTTRLMQIFQSYTNGKTYKRQPLFYEEWNDETSSLLMACDEEVQIICGSFDTLDLSNVISLKEHYESSSKHELTKKITSIPGFKGLLCPMINTGNGFIPDFESRYFTADFGYGLSLYLQLAKLLNLETPVMERIMNWYRNVMPVYSEICIKEYGINSVEDILKFYNR